MHTVHPESIKYDQDGALGRWQTAASELAEAQLSSWRTSVSPTDQTLQLNITEVREKEGEGGRGRGRQREGGHFYDVGGIAVVYQKFSWYYGMRGAKCQDRSCHHSERPCTIGDDMI